MNRNENVEILVNFAMASGETQNFSMPIYSGTFSYKCTFMQRSVSKFKVKMTFFYTREITNILI